MQQVVWPEAVRGLKEEEEEEGGESDAGNQSIRVPSTKAIVAKTSLFGWQREFCRVHFTVWNKGETTDVAEGQASVVEMLPQMA